MQRWFGWAEGGLVALAGLLVAVALVEKVARLLHGTVLERAYDPWRMTDLATILLLFAIVLHLIELRREVRGAVDSGR